MSENTPSTSPAVAPMGAAPVPAPAAAAPSAPQPPSGVRVEGILDVGNKGDGSLLDPVRGGKSRPTDPFVPRDMIKRFRLRSGSHLVAMANVDPRFPNPKVRFIEKIDGMEVEARRRCFEFLQLTTIAPNEHLKLELKDGRMTTRVMDLFCPIGKGTRGLIVAPPRTGKTTLLRDIALGILQNHPECHLMMLLVDERPEEVTDMRRSVTGAEVWASSNDENIENHIRVAEIAIERAKRLVEAGKDVVLVMDSLTRLARAHNNARSHGKTGSGGLDTRALEKPRQLFAAARNSEEAGSLTIIASALIETGSRMDDVIFQEFKGTGNMEMVLDRKVAEMRIWPAINIGASGTRKEELLLDAKALEGIHFFRRALANSKIEEATETAITRLSKTADNEEFLKLIAR